MKRYVIARTSLVGYHAWPTPTIHREYLGNSHRHDFGVEVGVEVTHDDREVEYHDLIDLIGEAWSEQWHGSSCETIATVLAERLRVKGVEPAWVEVNEDGRSGSRVEWSQ